MMNFIDGENAGENAGENLEFGQLCSRLGVGVSPQACVSPFECQRDRAFKRVLSVEMDMSASPQMKKFIPLLRHITRHSVAKAVIMSCLNFITTNTLTLGPPIIFMEGHTV